MQVKTYTNEHGDEFTVEELNRKEFVEWARWAIEAVCWFESSDTTLWVEYKDGTHYYCGYYDCDSSDSRIFDFRKTNIVWGLISNASTWQVFGEYELDENMVPQRKTRE